MIFFILFFMLCLAQLRYLLFTFHILDNNIIKFDTKELRKWLNDTPKEQVTPYILVILT